MKVTLNPNKCEFNLTNVKFYGFVFSAGGIHPDPDKIKAFDEIKTPKNVSEVRILLGMINYCGRFIPQLASLTQPLRCLVKKNSVFKWGQKEIETLNIL